MSWFESQIRERREADDRLLEDSLLQISGVVLGRQKARELGDERMITSNAIDEVLKYFHCKPVEIPESISDPVDQLEYALRPHGIMYRRADLTKGWYRDSFGPMLSRTVDGAPIALIPSSFNSYTYVDPETGANVKVNSRTEANIADKGIVLYRPLPQKKLTIPDLIGFMKSCISTADITMLIAATLMGTFMGMAMPRAIRALTGPVLGSGSPKALAGIAVCMVCIALSTQLMSSVRGMIARRFETKTSVAVQSAMMMRVLSLPAGFFRQYRPGELKKRVMSVSQLCAVLLGMVMMSGLSSVASLMYVTQIFQFASVLVIPSLLIVLITVAFSTAATYVQISINRKQMESSLMTRTITASSNTQTDRQPSVTP